MLGRNWNARYLIVLQNKLQITYQLPTETIISNKKTAITSRKRIIKCAESLRREHRTQVAMAREATGKGNLASIIRGMEQMEILKRLYRNIRYMEGFNRGGTTTQVTITAADGTKTEYTTRAEVEEHIIRETEKKYHQTETGGCQFLTQDFRAHFWEFGEGPATQQVLDGTFEIPESVSAATTDFLNACQYADGAINMVREEPIAQRYHKYTKSWAIRKENYLL